MVSSVSMADQFANRIVLRAVAVSLAVLAATPGLAQSPSLVQSEAGGGAGPVPGCDLAPGGSGRVADIVDGDTLVLADGRIVRLMGVEAPKPFLVRPAADVGMLAEKARRELARLIAGKAVEIRLGEQQSDRHGRILAHLFLDDGTWVQHRMVDAGFARIRPFAGEDSCLSPLRAPENAARLAGRGLWQNPEFTVISAYDPSLIERKGLYVSVVGRIISVGRGNRIDFLNFGHNWRRDFTVMVGASVSEALAESGMPIETFATRLVRIRGVIEESGGPAIRLSDPGEIEFLEDD